MKDNGILQGNLPANQKHNKAQIAQTQKQNKPIK